MIRPELVAPAGTLEKAEAAFIYGADAVYLGGTEFSLRAYAGNFTSQQLAEVLLMARARGKKVYVAVNFLAHNEDIGRLAAYLEYLDTLGVDGIIVSDLGVMELASRYAPGIPVTISTQASVANYVTARVYQDMGAKRIVLARELTLQEIAEIRDRVTVELEVFVHGAMCVAYSGRCLLSSFMTGRSGNRGECAHPCRYQYRLVEEKRPGEYFPIEEDDRGTYILNSRDLCLVEHIPELVKAGVNAFKIEGRMKSAHYVATTSRVYREAIQAAVEGRSGDLAAWRAELGKVGTRPYTTGFLLGPPQEGQDVYKDFKPSREAFCGIVRKYDPERRMALVEQRAPFGREDVVEFLRPEKPGFSMKVEILYDLELEPVERARHAQQLVWLPVPEPLDYFTILRRLPGAVGGGSR